MSATQFWFIPSVFVADAFPFDDAVQTSVPGSPLQALSSIFGFLTVLLLISKEWALAGSTADEKLDAILSHFEAQLAQIPDLSNWMSRMESHVTNALGGFAAGLTEMEHVFSALTASMCKVETGVTSASRVSRSHSGSFPVPGQNDGSTATGSRDPGSSEEGRNTRRRLHKDTSPDDDKIKNFRKYAKPERWLYGTRKAASKLEDD